MSKLIGRSLMKKCVEGRTLNEKRAEFRAIEEGCKMAGYKIAAAIESVQRELIASVVAGISASSYDLCTLQSC